MDKTPLLTKILRPCVFREGDGELRRSDSHFSLPLEWEGVAFPLLPLPLEKHLQPGFGEILSFNFARIWKLQPCHLILLSKALVVRQHHFPILPQEAKQGRLPLPSCAFVLILQLGFTRTCFAVSEARHLCAKTSLP